MPPSAVIDRPILDILTERGFLQQCSDAPGLAERLASGPITFYAGFDPTADCLHVGHLLPILAMRWLQLAGHRPIVVQGGGTGRIGDPTGKEKTREILDDARIDANLAAQAVIFHRFLDLEPDQIVDNASWLMRLGYIHFLRDVGVHFSVNRMLASSGAQLRLDRGQGYSFIEFNYHLLQSYDFLELHRRHDCQLQLGGDDQWFNILGGVDLIRRETGATTYGLTHPLLLTAAGTKMGKTEKGAVWIDRDRLPVYDFYQYWINVDDRDVIRLMKLYTFLPLARINQLAELTGAEIRTAKRVLAREATAVVHGEEAADEAEKAALAAFSGAVNDAMPSHAHALPAPVVEVLVASGLCSSKGEARRFIQGGGVRIGSAAVSDINALMSGEDVLWLGKKKCVRVTAA